MNALLVVGCLAPGAASSAEPWLQLGTSARGVDEDSAATFNELLAGEIGARKGVSVGLSETRCADHPCAAHAATEAKATTAVIPRLSRLGDKILVTVAVVSAQGALVSQHRLGVDRVEDLEEAAVRIATAIATGKSTDQTAELGSITEAEVPTERRREGRAGLALEVGGVAPVGNPVRGGMGVAAALGYWYETSEFSIEPRLGVRLSTSADGEDAYTAIQLDVLGHYIFSKGNVAPLVGLGVGIRYLDVTRLVHLSMGETVRVEKSYTDNEGGWGPGLMGRLGVQFFRTYTVSLLAAVDYELTVVGLHGEDVAQLVTFGMGVLF